MKEKIKKLFDTKTTHGKIMRLVLVLVVLGIVCLIGYFILRATGLWHKVNSVDKIRNIVEKGGAFSFIIFMLFQILQTTVLQIPAVFVTMAGTAVFGVWPTFFMTFVSVLIGSIIMFWIGRKVGRPFLYWLVGKDTAELWIEKMAGGKYLFFLMMVFPCFPDDILCAIAGLTNMSFNFFWWTNVIARGLGIICTCFFTKSLMISLHGWGIAFWTVFFVIVGILFFLSIKYKEKIDNLIDKILKKFKKKKVAKNVNDKDVNNTADKKSDSEKQEK